MTAKKKPEKKRRGRAVKPKKGDAATFENGAAAAPKSFDAEAVLKDLNVWWEAEGGDTFWVGDENGWAKWPKDALLDLCLAKHFVARKKRDGEFMPQSSQLLIYLRTHRRVDGVMWGLAGYPAGLHKMPSGERVIVRNSPTPVVPKEGDWSTVKEMIEGRLDLRRDGVAVSITADQVLYFHAWHRVVLSSLLNGKPGSWTQRPLLVLAGPHGCGKSRLQVMITNGLLGGRVANPKAYLTGKDSFNANMVKAEHLMMEELDNVSQKMVDRLAFSEAVKALVASTGVTLRLMRTDPMTITPFWAPTLSMNNDPDKLRSFPPLTPDFRDKVLMLLVRRAPLPMPTITDEDKERFNATIAAQLPAYAHWLLHNFVVPQELLVDDDGEEATRFGCRSWQHPTLADELFEDTPAAELLQLIDSALWYDGVGEHRLWELESQSKHRGALWEGSAEELERLIQLPPVRMAKDEPPDLWCSLHAAARKLCMHNKVSRLLGRLEKDKPDRIAPHRTKIERRWVVSKPV